MPKTLNEMFGAFAEQECACGKFVGNLFHAATVAHFMHLTTNSYAAHKALAEFYDALPALVDAVAESYMGKYGMITGFPTTYTYTESDPVKYLISMCQFIADIRQDLPQDSELQNDIDTIVTLCNSTIYKLRFLS